MEQERARESFFFGFKTSRSFSRSSRAFFLSFSFSLCLSLSDYLVLCRGGRRRGHIPRRGEARNGHGSSGGRSHAALGGGGLLRGESRIVPNRRAQATPSACSSPSFPVVARAGAGLRGRGSGGGGGGRLGHCRRLRGSAVEARRKRAAEFPARPRLAVVVVVRVGARFGGRGGGGGGGRGLRRVVAVGCRAVEARGERAAELAARFRLAPAAIGERRALHRRGRRRRGRRRAGLDSAAVAPAGGPPEALGHLNGLGAVAVVVFAGSELLGGVGQRGGEGGLEFFGPVVQLDFEGLKRGWIET